ncbi:MAG: hypothetical protein MJD61_18870, partial [Proteobacteria bacterium]|nr:hypothetical protein [Pseudomonadota bacterium]
GVSRYEQVQAQMLAWAAAQADIETLTLSLFTPSGLLAQHLLASQWGAALQDYVPATSRTSNDLLIFDQALTRIEPEPPLPGMAQSLWLISAVPPAAELGRLGEWAATLEEQGIPLFLWLVDAPARLASEEAAALQNLAAISGGQAFLFSNEELLPNPDTYFTPLSQAYYFQYESPASSSGEHSVQLQWARQDVVVESQPLSYSFIILPPNPIFVTPPSRIERLPYEEDPTLLSPFSQPLEILIEFPDNYPREVLRSTLFVNGQPVAENLTAPFNNFIWDLQAYSSSQQLLLAVEVEDELGRVGRSEDHTIQIATQPPPTWFQALLARGAPALALAMVLIVAGAVFVVLVISGRIQPPALATTEDIGEGDPMNEAPIETRAGPPDPDEALPMAA